MKQKCIITKPATHFYHIEGKFNKLIVFFRTIFISQILFPRKHNLIRFCKHVQLQIGAIHFASEDRIVVVN